MNGGNDKDTCVSGNIILGCENLVFVANIEGAQEVPPVDTNASGAATFMFTEGNEEIKFKVSIQGLDFPLLVTPEPEDDIIAAHIHLAPFGENGPVVGFISPTTVDDLVVDFIEGLITGTITSDSLVGDLSDEPLSRLIDEMSAGFTYVNIQIC